MENTDGFRYTYSAAQQQEIENIRKKYLPKEEKKDELNEWRVQLEDKDELSQ